MATTHSESTSHKNGKHGSEKLGRSAATGRFVLKPASKPGSISLEQASTAVKSVNSQKNK